MKTFNIILANTPINNENRGCVALTISSIYLIDKALRGQQLEYKIFILDSNIRHQAKYSIWLLDKEIVVYPISYPIGIGLVDWGKIIMNVPELIKSIRTFLKSDYIFDIGQGDSFADIYGYGRFSIIDRIHKLARLFHKPYCLLPQTIGPFKDLRIQKKAVKSIKKASVVMARDKMSFDFVKEYVPEQFMVKEYIDVAFFLPFKKKNFDNHYIHVGLNISALLWNGGYTRNNQFGLKCDYRKTVRSIIDYFLRLDNVFLHLVPHVVGGERGIENDYEVSFDLYEVYNNNHLVLAPLFLSPIDAKSYIAGMDFFIGARMHATIAAFSSGVPVVPMAYSRKFNGLFVDTLQYDNMVDMKEKANEEIISTIKRHFANRDGLKKVIDERMVNVVNERKIQLLNNLAYLWK